VSGPFRIKAAAVERFRMFATAFSFGEAAHHEFLLRPGLNLQPIQFRPRIEASGKTSSGLFLGIVARRLEASRKRHDKGVMKSRPLLWS
jgi:hypothetical protein